MKGDVKNYQIATQVTLLEVVLKRGGVVGMTYYYVPTNIILNLSNPIVVAVEQRKYRYPFELRYQT